MCFDKQKRGVAAILVLLLITSMVTIPGFVQEAYAALGGPETENTSLPGMGEVEPGEVIDLQATAGAVTLMDENLGADAAAQGAAASTQSVDLKASEEWKNYADTDWHKEGSTSFEISSAEELAGLAQLVNNGNTFEGKTITLTSGINLSGKNWTPIGMESGMFMGTFKGNGRTIKGLTCEVTTENSKSLAGLFGKVSFPAKIHNVNLMVQSVFAGGNDGSAGGLVALMHFSKDESKITEISDCHITVEGLIVGAVDAGGLVGSAGYANISDCKVDIEKSGEIKGKITEASQYAFVGGLLGNFAFGSISQCRVYNNGKINLEIGMANDHYAMAGILCGGGHKISVTDCYTVLRSGGSISASGDNNVSRTMIGGLIGGISDDKIDVSNSYAMVETGGTVSIGGGGKNAALLLGSANGHEGVFTRNYGYGPGVPLFSDPQLTGITFNDCVEFESIDDLKIESNFAGFNFEKTWGLGSKDYPIFQKEEPENIITFINPKDPLGIGDKAVFGQTLEAVGTISPAAANATASYRWFRTTGSTSTEIATGGSYTLKKEDIDSKISLEVKGSKPYMSVKTTPLVSVTKAPCESEIGALTGKVPSGAAAADGAINGLNPELSYEYRAGAAGTYAPVKKGGVSIGGLAAGTYQIRIAETDTHLPSDPATVVIPAYGTVPIQGTVSLSGTPKFGETLTAEASSVTPQEAQAGLSYSWYRGEDLENAVATGSAYQLKAEDIGKIITLKAEGTGAYTGSVPLTSSGIIRKAETPTPDAPKAAEDGITVNSVTLVTEAGVQYRCGENGAWQDDGLFTGLNEGTAYKFYAKKPETETHEESPVSEALSVTTLKGTYSIRLDKTEPIDMGSVEEGYDAAEVEDLVIKVTNIGDQPITNVTAQLTGSGISAFEVNGMDLDRLEVGKTGRIIVVPAEKLNPGTYEATLIVTGTEGGEARVGLSFEVKKKPTIIESAQISLTAPAAGYSPQNAFTAADTFTVDSTIWTKLGEPEEPAGETFDFESAYKATVTLKANENCQFSEAVTISGIQAEGLTITHVDESGLTFEAAFAPTAARPGEEATVIEDAPLILAAPHGGAAPGEASTTTDAAATFQVISTTWTTAEGQPVTDQFDYEAIYKATVLLSVKDGYAFSADRTTVSGITGQGIVVSGFNVPEGGASLQIEFTFPATDPRPGVTVSGIVKGYNAKHLPTITLSKEGVVVATASAVEAVSIAGNQFVQRSFTFTFEGIAPDTYELKAMKGGHLSVTVKNVVVGREALDLTQDSRDAVKALELPCGNLVLAASEDNDVINIADKNLIANAKNWNKKTDSADGPEEPLTDLNGDGVVNIADKNLVANLVNWNQKPVVIE